MTERQKIKAERLIKKIVDNHRELMANIAQINEIEKGLQALGVSIELFTTEDSLLDDLSHGINPLGLPQL